MTELLGFCEKEETYSETHLYEPKKSKYSFGDLSTSRAKNQQPYIDLVLNA